MSAGCWFPLLQQGDRVGMWLLVPQPCRARKRKSLGLSHPGTWLKVLRGQPGSLDQTPVISSRCFQTKQKIWFSLALRICSVFFRAERTSKDISLFSPEVCTLGCRPSLCTQALKCIFSLCPCLPFLPAEETGCVSPSAIPGKLFPGGGRRPTEGQGQCPVSSPWNWWVALPPHTGEPCCALGGQQALGVFSYPSTSFLLLTGKIQVCLPCMLSSMISGQKGLPGWSTCLCLYPSWDWQCCSEKGWFLGWTGLLVHPCCLDCPGVGMV